MSRSMTEPGTERAGVVIAGGGVAALECLMALRDLAGAEVPITLVAPSDAFVYRPMHVAEPFALGHARRYPLAELAREFDAAFVREPVVEVRATAREAVLGSGATRSYEALVLAPGARAEPAFEHAITFGQEGARDALDGLLADLEGGYARRVAFVVPPGVTWSLPLYELAVMTARDVWNQGMDAVHLWLVTPEPQPLAVFGPAASDAVGELLAGERIEFVGSTYAAPARGVVVLEPSDRRIDVDRVVALPVLRGPAIAGVPQDPDGFIRTDVHGRVPGLDDVFAAGDGADFPVKQGGLATQQADAVAECVAARLGASITPRPFKPVLRGLLFTGGPQQFLRAGIGGGEGEGTAAGHALWWPPTKVAGAYLAPYLFDRDEAAALGRPPAGFTHVEVPVGEAHGIELMGGRRPRADS